MNKLISNPTECGYRKSIFTRLGIPFGMECTHKNKPCTDNVESLKGIVSCCNWDKEFPVNCPLHDGVSTPKSIEELILLAEQEFGKISNPYNHNGLFEECTKHKHTYYKNGRRVYPPIEHGSYMLLKEHKDATKTIRRSRKDCIHIKVNRYGLSNFECAAPDLGYYCVGVNCGCFKTKS